MCCACWFETKGAPRNLKFSVTNVRCGSIDDRSESNRFATSIFTMLRTIIFSGSLKFEFCDNFNRFFRKLSDFPISFKMLFYLCTALQSSNLFKIRVVRENWVSLLLVEQRGEKTRVDCFGDVQCLPQLNSSVRTRKGFARYSLYCTGLRSLTVSHKTQLPCFLCAARSPRNSWLDSLFSQVCLKRLGCLHGVGRRVGEYRYRFQHFSTSTHQDDAIRRPKWSHWH